MHLHRNHVEHYSELILADGISLEPTNASSYVHTNMHTRISTETWEQAKTAYASGIGLRELARRMGIPIGTMLSRASREHWTRRIEMAKSLAKPVEQAVVPACDAAAQTMQTRAERHVARMAGITDSVLSHLENMEPAEILDSARRLERFDYVARRNYGLENQPSPGGIINLAILTNQAAVQVLRNPA
jgi:hypothetical protein